MLATAHAAPFDETATARLQAVELVLEETLSALIAAQPDPAATAATVADRSRAALRRLGPVDDIGFAVELERQVSRMTRNLVLRIGLIAVGRRG